MTMRNEKRRKIERESGDDIVSSSFFSSFFFYSFFTSRLLREMREKTREEMQNKLSLRKTVCLSLSLPPSLAPCLSLCRWLPPPPPTSFLFKDGRRLGAASSGDAHTFYAIVVELCLPLNDKVEQTVWIFQTILSTDH